MTFLQALVHILYGGALNALLLRSAARLLARVPGLAAPSREGTPEFASVLDRFVAVVVIAASLVVVLVSAGGAAGLLDRRGVMLLLAGVLCLGVEIGTRTAAARRGAGAPASGGGVPASGGGAPAVAGAFRLLDDGAVRAAAALVAVAWLPLLGERITLPPVAWDALTYHLRFPALWLQTGHLATCAAPVGDASHTYYPLAGEMLLYWQFLSMGTDIWSSLSQIPFALAAAAAIASLAIRCGSGVRMAALAALCWLGTPGVMRQSVEAMVDIEQACFFAATLLFAVRWRSGGGTAWLLLSAAALGLLAGTKYTGVVYAIAAAPLLVWSARGTAGRSGAGRPGGVARPGAATLAAALVLALALGGYAYARNLAAGGNPFLPLQVAFRGITLLRGSLASAFYFGAESRRLGWPAFFASGRAVLDMGPVLVPLLIALPLGLVVAIPRGGRDGRLPAMLAAAGLLGFILAGTVLPYREHRYFYPVTAVAWCVAAMLAATLAAGPTGSRIARWGAVCLLAVQAPITLFYWGKDLVVAGGHIGHVAAAALVAVLCFLLAVRRRARRDAAVSGPRGRPRRMRLAAAAGACLILLAGATSVYQRSKYDLWYRYWSTRYPWKSILEPRADTRDMAASWRFMARQPVSSGSAVAYAGMNIPYPLVGPGLDRRVLFVPRNGNASSSFYDWGSAPLDPLSNGSRAAWSQNVDRLGVEYLCVYRETPELDPRLDFPVERVWADADPRRFPLLWSAPTARIYRVLPARAEGAARKPGP